MNSTHDTGVVDPGVRRGETRPRRGLAVTGILAVLVAMVVTTLTAALARAAGVDLAVSGGETIPLTGVTVMTGFFSLVGLVLAVALGRWSAHPAKRWVWTAWPLTAISWVPPLLAAADSATAVALIGLHLVAALVMIPALAQGLRARAD